MKRLTAVLDPNGNPMNGINVSDFVDAMVLGVATAEVYTIPTGVKIVRLTGTTPFYVNFGAAAAVPAGRRQCCTRPWACGIRRADT